MNHRRPARIWGLIAEQAASHGGPVSAADACAAAAAAMAVTGGWLSAGQGPQPGHLVHATDGVSERLAELQLTLGEGPVPDVYATGAPVLASDLGDTDIEPRWPVFAPAARQAGAAAIFAFPLQIGAIRSGVLGLYRDQAGPLSALQLGDALIFADTATLLLLGAQGHPGNGLPANGLPANGLPANGLPANGLPANGLPANGLPANGLPANGLPANGLPANGLPANGLPANGLPANGLPANGLPARLGAAGQPATLGLGHAEIDQATGMLTEQLGVSITDAYLRLRAYAFVNDLRLTDVARDIVARRLRLRPDPGTSEDGEA